MIMQISRYAQWWRSALGKLLVSLLVLQVICPPTIARAQNLMQPATHTSVTGNASLYLPLVTNGNQLPTTDAPVILSFEAAPEQIVSGAATTLAWSVSNATRVSIAGIGVVTGASLVVTPT